MTFLIDMYSREVFNASTRFFVHYDFILMHYTLVGSSLTVKIVYQMFYDS